MGLLTKGATACVSGHIQAGNHMLFGSIKSNTQISQQRCWLQMLALALGEELHIETTMALLLSTSNPVQQRKL